MIHINNRSDFSIVWKMPNGGILPTFTYTLEFSTRGGLRYAVKSDDESRFIPKSDADGQIRSAVIVFDFSNRPHLPSGRLSFTMKAAIPNTMYPDDYQDITEPHPTNAELWDGATDYKDAIEVELVLPYVKGDKGDAGEGVPAGGRTGQVLKKKSDGDYDTTWGDGKGITDIAPGAVGTKEIADNAVTELKLAKGVRDNINGKLNKTEISTEPTASTVIRRDNNGRAKVATPEADDDIANKQYVDAQKIKEPEKAGNFVVLDVNGMPAPSDYKPESFRKASDKIQTNDIAEKTITLPKLGDDVAAKLNGYASKEDVAAVANVATSAASAAADAQTSADAAANAAIAAGNVAETAKETAENAQTAASGAVRFDAAQELTVEQQEQVSNNVGVPMVIMKSSELGKALSESRGAQVENAAYINLIKTNGQNMLLLSCYSDSSSIYFISLYTDKIISRIVYNKTTRYISNRLEYNIQSGSVLYNTPQNLTSAQQSQARTNIDGMKNTPSGDPMHYIYETAGAEWIPYADISTEGLEDWQVETLNMTQAQADGGVWWHNGIFVTVEQNRINYVLTVGHYPANTPDYSYYLTGSSITTNYKQIHQIIGSRSFNTLTHNCNNLVVVSLPDINISDAKYMFSSSPKLVKVSGICMLSSILSFAGSFRKVGALKYINLKGLNANIDLSGASNLSMTSIVYAVTNAGTASFTITLAPAVYAAAMADADVQAALAAKSNVTLADAGASSSGGN